MTKKSAKKRVKSDPKTYRDVYARLPLDVYERLRCHAQSKVRSIASVLRELVEQSV